MIYVLDIYYIHESRVKAKETEIQEKMVKKLLSVNERLAVRRQFDSFDKDGDGHITRSELFNIMHSIGEEDVTDAEIEKLMNEFDLDKNGTIEFAEFSMVVEHFKAKKELNPISQYGSIGGFVAKEWNTFELSYVADILSAIPFNLLFYSISNQTENFLLFFQFFKVSCHHHLF